MRYVVQANRHTVEVTRSLDGEFLSPFRRLLHLYDLIQISGPPLTLGAHSGIFISFYDVLPTSLGKFQQFGIVNVKASLGDFEDMYRVVRHESPIQFIWEESADGRSDIVYYVLHAG
jgi:hypothetical protein